MSAGQVLLLAFVVPFTAACKRSSAPSTNQPGYGIFAACLVLFYFLAHAGVPLGVVFFLWIGIFNVMIVAQFWSFANDLYNENEGERLFPIVGFGASIGAVLGALIAGVLIRPLGVYQLMLVGAAILVAEVQITNYLDKKERQRTEAHFPENETTALMPAATVHRRDSETSMLTLAKEDKEDKPKRSGAFVLVFRTRYLLLIAFLMLFSNWVNTTGEYILGSVVEESAREAVDSGEADGLTVEEYIGRFYSQFYGVVNIAGVLMQLFLVSRIIRYFGVHVGVLILPFTSFVAYNILAFFPILAAVRWPRRQRTQPTTP